VGAPFTAVGALPCYVPAFPVRDEDVLSRHTGCAGTTAGVRVRGGGVLRARPASAPCLSRLGSMPVPPRPRSPGAPPLARVRRAHSRRAARHFGTYVSLSMPLHPRGPWMPLRRCRGRSGGPRPWRVAYVPGRGSGGLGEPVGRECDGRIAGLFPRTRPAREELSDEPGTRAPGHSAAGAAGAAGRLGDSRWLRAASRSQGVPGRNRTPPPPDNSGRRGIDVTTDLPWPPARPAFSRAFPRLHRPVGHVR
jgi:hypothetical protein